MQDDASAGIQSLQNSIEIKLCQNPGDRLYLNEKVLYADDGTKNIETGDMLGDMTDEISGKGISSFASTGPKSYSFKYGDNEQKSAIKGFTLNHENNNLLNHDSLSKIVKKTN